MMNLEVQQISNEWVESYTEFKQEKKSSYI